MLVGIAQIWWRIYTFYFIFHTFFETQKRKVFSMLLILWQNFVLKYSTLSIQALVKLWFQRFLIQQKSYTINNDSVIY